MTSFEAIRNATGEAMASSLNDWVATPRYQDSYLAGGHHGERLFFFFDNLNHIEDKYQGIQAGAARL